MTKQQSNNSCDAFLGGKFHIWQPKTQNHRAGIEPIILASLVPKNAKGKMIDMGAGCGAIGFAVATRCKNVKITLAEKQKKLVELMEESKKLKENKNIKDNIEKIENIDILDKNINKTLKNQTFEWVIANPPFRKTNQQKSPFEGKQHAHSMKNNKDIIQWVQVAARLLKAKGTMMMIITPECLSDIMPAVNKSFGDITLLPIQSYENKIAKRLVISAKKGTKTPLIIQPPLIVHKQNGQYTKKIKDMVKPK